ncbi:MAG TPA: TRC40/GET3/ArsA family transport-energizing ATPase [Acidimicrobiales bacterium]
MSRRASRRTRVLLFTGKGGVGKTTTAAATALACADAGLRTIVLSTDAAHSLGDAFDQPLGGVATTITPHLWAQQLDATERFEESWYEIQGWLRDVLDWAGLEAIEAEELSLLPGLEEVFALADLKAYTDSGQWDVVVVDCGPTAETIRFLSFPDVLAWYMERLFPLSRRVNRVLSPVVARVSTLPVARDHVFAAVRRFYDRLDGVREILTDADTTSVRLVVNAEKMVIAEARRTHTYLSLFGYHTDAVIVNRLLPTDIDDPFFERWLEVQGAHLESIIEGFAPLPVLRVPLAADELVGVEALRAMATGLWPGGNPAAVLHRGDTMRVEEHGDRWELVLPLPFADGDDVELGRTAGELLVRVGPYRRAVLLPATLRRRTVVSARVDGDVLRVTFTASDDTVAVTLRAPADVGGVTGMAAP